MGWEALAELAHGLVLALLVGLAGGRRVRPADGDRPLGRRCSAAYRYSPSYTIWYGFPQPTRRPDDRRVRRLFVGGLVVALLLEATAAASIWRRGLSFAPISCSSTRPRREPGEGAGADPGRAGLFGGAEGRQGRAGAGRRRGARGAGAGPSLGVARRDQARPRARPFRLGRGRRGGDRRRQPRPAASPTCCSQRGAAKVFAVDVGTNQLAWKLRQDPRVVVLEQTNARYLTAADRHRAGRPGRLRRELHRARQGARHRARLRASPAGGWSR